MNIIRKLCIRWYWLDYNLKKFRWYRRWTGYVWISWTPKVYPHMSFWDRASAVDRHASVSLLGRPYGWNDAFIENEREYY